MGEEYGSNSTSFIVGHDRGDSILGAGHLAVSDVLLALAGGEMGRALREARGEVDVRERYVCVTVAVSRRSAGYR